MLVNLKIALEQRKLTDCDTLTKKVSALFLSLKN